MQRLLAGAKWDVETVRDDLRGYVVEHVGDARAVLQTVELDRGGFACALGGLEERTLFIMAAEFPGAVRGTGPRTGQVVVVETPVPGAGWP